MKTKKQLQILHKIRKEVVKLKQMCDKYQQYLADNLIIINSKEKLEKLRECETKLVNITLAILDSKSTFSEGRDLWNDLKDYSNKKINVPTKLKTSVYKGYKQDKIEMRGDRAEMSDFPLYLNMVAGGLDCRDQAIGGFSFVVKIYALPVVEIIGQLLYLLGRYGFNAQFGDCL